MGEKDAATTSLLPTLREASRFRYTCVLYAPAAKREALAALHVFLSEIERVRDLVSEPLPGEIRLQWWRDVIAGIRSDEARQSPAADALTGVVDRYGLSKERFDAYLEAMTFDLYDDPMPTTADLEGFFGETQSVFLQMAAQVLCDGDQLPDGNAAGHGGVAFGVTGALMDTAKHRARGQVYVPADLLSAQSLDRDGFVSGEHEAGCLAALQQFAAFGLDHLSRWRSNMDSVPTAAKPAFMPLALCEPVLKRVAENPALAIAADLEPNPIALQWHMFRFSTRL